MKVGDKVTSKLRIASYMVDAGDTGVIIQVCDGESSYTNGYVVCKWDKDGHTDLGWWLTDKPTAAAYDSKQYLNVTSNLEIEISLPDTRDYLETIAGLAAQP